MRIYTSTTLNNNLCSNCQHLGCLFTVTLERILEIDSNYFEPGKHLFCVSCMNHYHIWDQFLTTDDVIYLPTVCSRDKHQLGCPFLPIETPIDGNAEYLLIKGYNGYQYYILLIDRDITTGQSLSPYIYQIFRNEDESKWTLLKRLANGTDSYVKHDLSEIEGIAILKRIMNRLSITH